MKVTTRTADWTEEEFLFTVYACTRTEELAQLPWTAEQKQAFLRMQSDAQLADYRRNYPLAEYKIIEQENEAIGRLIVDRSGDPILLLDIALMPEYRKGGLGTALLKDLISEAQKTNRSIRLHVETFNPAKRLYTRLGFSVSKDLGIYHEMMWEPKIIESPSAGSKA